MKRLFCLFAFGFAITSFGAGCGEKEAPVSVGTQKKAPVISASEALVSPDEADSAKDEPIPNIQGAMPCLQFKHSQGLLKWLSDYEAKESEAALKMAERIHLPENPDDDFLQALKQSQAEGSLQTSLCNIHNELQIFTWAVEFPEKTIVYTYRKPLSEDLTVVISARTQESINEEVNPLDAGLPVCLPKTITDTELIWFCGTPAETWREVHVNRKMGNMVQLLCEPNAKGKPSAGCLDPTAGQ